MAQTASNEFRILRNASAVYHRFEVLFSSEGVTVLTKESVKHYYMQFIGQHIRSDLTALQDLHGIMQVLQCFVHSFSLHVKRINS
jgi:hypothetical protein